MVDKQDDYIQQHLHHAQIANTLRHSRYFLISIMVICLYIFCIYHLQYRPSNTYFNTWFILTELLVSMCWLMSTLYFKPEQYDLKGAHRWLQIQSLAVGSCIAVGIYTIYYYLPQANPAFEDIEALTLSALLLIVTQAFGLTYLTQKLSYFCLVFLPSLFPFLLSQIYHVSLSNPFFGLALNFAVIVILLCANSSYRIHRRTSRLYAENSLLVKNAEQQVAWTDELCQQLQTEVNKSKDIELQLQLNNQLLEQKVRERTYDIEQINHHLKNQQQNLQLAHEIAGIRPWDWNIQDRTITLTNHKDEKILRDSKDHHLQLEYLIHPDDLDYFKSNMKQHLRGRIERYDVTYRIQLSDGSWSWVHDIGRVIQRDPKNNKPLRMVGIRRDIQQERISQERLKLVASVLEQAAEGIFILNPELYYIDVNPHYEYL
ncbi:MAG: PAS domain-containing protein, partial [Acinetobacter pseudolwoffii]